MKCRVLALLLAVSLLLGGCSWFRGRYVSVTPYQHQFGTAQTGAVSAWNYSQLRSALEALVSSGVESSVIDVANYDDNAIKRNLEQAVTYIMRDYPVGAYAVERIDYEVGTSSGKPAVALTVTYRRSRAELMRIQKVESMEEASEALGEALQNYRTGLVMEIRNYRETDFVQLVEDYAERYPEYVMEVPQVTTGSFGRGGTRVVELAFSYQTNRDSLRQMRNQVKPMFDSAALYVSSASTDRQRYTQLYSFLMERFDYTIETSITPAYSLLHHGVGDSRAFALVYASMCRRVGLDCRIVTGTRNGEPRAWNIIMDGDRFYHVDLLRCNDLGDFREFSDTEMSGYVWDYSAYPECPAYSRTESGSLDKKPAATKPPEETAAETTQPEEF